MTKVLFIDFNICPYFFVRTYMTAFQYEHGVNEKCAPSVLFYTFDHSITMQAMKEKVEEQKFFFWSFTLPSYFAFFGSGKFREPDKNDWAGIHNYIFFVHALIEIDQRAGTTLVRYFCWWQAHIWQLIDFSSDTLSPPSVGFYFLWHFIAFVCDTQWWLNSWNFWSTERYPWPKFSLRTEK